MRLVTRFTLFAVLLTLLGCGKAEAPSDGGFMIIHGGLMYLGAEQAPQTGQAILVHNGRIVSIGTREDLAAEAPGAQTIDATGMTVLPGLIDSHAHIDNLGQLRDIVNLVGTTSLPDVLNRMSERATDAPAGEWIEGRGWDQNDWEIKQYPTASQLDERFPDNPIWCERIDGHAGVTNSAAMKIAGITASTPDPVGGKIVRDPQGNPTGVLIDNAMDLVKKEIPPPSREVRKRRLIDALDYIASQGLTGVHDAASDNPDPRELIELYRELADEGRMPIRVYHMLTDSEPLFQEWFARGPLVNYGDRLTIRAVKLYADGALGSRGAALLVPYDDDPGNTGLATIAKERITDVANRARAAGFQVCTHAIGDRGNRTIIEAYEAAGVTPGDRYRIEHFQVVAPEDFERAARSGIIAAMQPTHATSDMPWAEARIGSERLAGAYAWRRVLDSGGHLALGSDFPVEDVNPFFGIYSAVTRQDHEGNPPGGWTPGERLTLAEAVHGFTLASAFASFDEKLIGSIEPGKAADFTIVEGNLPDIPESDLWKIRVAKTIVGGQVVYERE